MYFSIQKVHDKAGNHIGWCIVNAKGEQVSRVFSIHERVRLYAELDRLEDEYKAMLSRQEQKPVSVTYEDDGPGM
ncbi:hypothetical protein [Silvimonas sp.]|uniref:hypothetical protein n=1 Tax=Silvimonas sp. TaxID=2650811 RepID=UPI00283CE867|nr:hypothetical protein [Silvimonas sp.]MDR3429690.1 hypothetical protein [Silvimonas sp.]